MPQPIECYDYSHEQPCPTINIFNCVFLKDRFSYLLYSIHDMLLRSKITDLYMCKAWWEKNLYFSHRLTMCDMKTWHIRILSALYNCFFLKNSLIYSRPKLQTRWLEKNIVDWPINKDLDQRPHHYCQQASEGRPVALALWFHVSSAWMLGLLTLVVNLVTSWIN